MGKIFFYLLVGIAFCLSYVEKSKADFASFPICTDSGDQAFPNISGENVIWIDSDFESTGNVHVKNLTSGNDFSIDTSRTDSWLGWRPAIDGNIIAWADRRNTGPQNPNDFDIYGYDISTHTEFPIAMNGEQRPGIDVSGNIVVYTDTGPAVNYNISGYDLSTQTKLPISPSSATQGTPAVDGDIVVWSDSRAGNYDIYGYDLSSQSEFSICTCSNDSSNSDISDDIVVWVDNRNGNSDIYGYDLSTQTEFPICTISGPHGPVAIGRKASAKCGKK